LWSNTRNKGVAVQFIRTTASSIALILTLGVLAMASAAERIQAVASADGRLEIFVQSHSGGNIYHAWQTRAAAGSDPAGWHWEKADIKLTGDDFVAGRDSGGRLFVAAIQNGTIHINAQPGAGSSFGDPWALDTHDLHGLGLATDADGRTEFFALSGPGAAWSTAETQTGNRTFANHYVGGTKLRSIAPTPFKDGRLALVAVGGDRSVWWASQVAPNAGWNNWGSLGGHDIQVLAAGANADGRLDIVALGADKALYHRYEVSGGGFSSWETLAVGRFSEPLSMVRNADGRLEVFLHDDMTRIVHAWQLSPNGAWSNFTVLDNIVSNTRANSLTRMPDGRLVIAAIGDGDQYPEINIAGQIRANGPWQAWSRPPIADPPPPPKPSINFTATPDNAYGPIGTTFTFAWTVANCGSDCVVSFVGKTGLGNYDTVFFSAAGLKAQGQLSVKPQDTNTLYVLTAISAAGSDSKKIEGKIYGSPSPGPCAGCTSFYFKLVPPSNLLPCAKKMYVAKDASSAEQMAHAEFPGWVVTTITASQFVAVGC
jgi:hypothetical protein